MRVSDGDRASAAQDGRRADRAVASLLVCCDGQVALHAIPRDAAIAIGRGRDCAIRIEHRTIARRHAVIHGGSPLQIEDVGSPDGIRVRGVRLAAGQRAALTIGAAIELGGVAAFVQRGSLALDRSAAASNGARHAAGEAAGAAAPSLIAADPAMQRLIQLLRVIAPMRQHVAFLGEPGVGKRAFAEALHQLSPRRAAPFVALRCAAIPDAQLEAELFGYQRGAFAGATQAKPGVFEAGDGGSVLLDDLDELPRALHARLQRAFDTGEVTRLGSTAPRRTDVRIAAATSRGLDERGDTGGARPDLWMQLGGFTLVIPPLRDRPADVAPLARHFAAAAGGQAGCEVGDDAIEVWRGHAWRGNVRELRNAVERAVVLCRAGGGRIDAGHAHAALAGTTNVAQLAASALQRIVERPIDRPRGALRNELAALEKGQIETALQHCGGNQTRAAAMLGLGRRTLAMKLDVLGIARPRRRTVR